MDFLTATYQKKSQKGVEYVKSGLGTNNFEQQIPRLYRSSYSTHS